MVRSLWTAATGMMSQQTNVDTIANNLANVSTTGYKAQKNQFKSLLYQTLQERTTSANGESKPVGAQVGLGTRNAAITQDFTQGPLEASSSNTDFAIDGNGFFTLRGQNGETLYTRNGSFVWAVGTGNSIVLTNSDGLPVLNTSGQPISLNATQYSTSKITIDTSGRVCYPDANNNPQPIAGMQIALAQFSNPTGLERMGDSLYAASEASGAAMMESTTTNLQKSSILQSYLEGSNVEVATEMVNLIVAQRAYELNSKAITATDEMMQQANALRN